MKKYLIIAIIILIPILIFAVLRESRIRDVPKNMDTAVSNQAQTFEEPKYSVKVVEQPVYDSGNIEVTFSVEIENLKVGPFITNIGLNSCEFEDTSGNTYKSSPIGGEIHLTKALVIGEKTTVTFERIRTRPKLIRDNEVVCESQTQNSFTSLNKLEKCVYTPSGECVCTPIGPLNLNGCEIAITNNSKQASNGWGDSPQTFYFEN